jgi:hypothetical protein
MRDEQIRMADTYKTTFSDAVFLQSHSLGEMQDVVQGVVQALQHMHGGFEEVRPRLITLETV